MLQSGWEDALKIAGSHDILIYFGMSLYYSNAIWSSL